MSGAFLQWLREAFTENLGLKLMALVFSLGFFGYVHGREDIEQRTIPMSVISLPPEGGEKELMTRVPASVHLTVRGPARAMATLIHEGVPPVEVDLRQGYPKRVQFKREMFTLPRDVEIVMVDPPSFDLEWEDVVTRQVPLHASLTGTPADGRVVSGEAKVDPEKVTVRGPTTLVETMQFAALAPYVVTGLTEGTWARRIAITSPPQRVELLGQPAATVTIEVVRRKSDKRFPGLEVQVVGPSYASVLPRLVDVTVTGVPEAISALHEDQIVPRADLTAAGLFDKERQHGSATVPVVVDLHDIEAQIQPPSVTVKW